MATRRLDFDLVTYDGYISTARDPRLKSAERAGASPAPPAPSTTEALVFIARDGCEAYHGGRLTCRNSGRTRDARYGADRWCLPCVAADALERGNDVRYVNDLADDFSLDDEDGPEWAIAVGAAVFGTGFVVGLGALCIIGAVAVARWLGWVA
jgi:hypothetical protein